jgi:hypothetical protein
VAAAVAEEEEEPMATCFTPRSPKTTLYREFLTLDNPILKIQHMARALIADACHFPATSTLPSLPTMTHIFVEDCWGMRLEFHATLSDPVHTLKQMIEETDGKLIGVCMLFI